MPFSSCKDSVALYLRKSRMDPESESIDETLSRHEGTLLKLADTMGLNICKIYKEVVSGDGLFTRPQMLQLLQDVENDRYCAVLCMEIDRLGRSSQKDGGIILETLKEHNVYIITQNRTYNLNDELDEQSVEMQSFIARQELRAIRRRLRKGVEKTVEQGFFVAPPPYGYRRTYINKRPTLEIYEEEAQIIRMVFDMYVNQGFGSQTIADELNRMGFIPRSGGLFSRSTVQFYLQNPAYTGKIVWNRHRRIKKKSLTDKTKEIKNPESDWIKAEGMHPAIISAELFNSAQQIRLSRAHPPALARTLQNPLAGLIYCKNCGSAMVRRKIKDQPRLLCPKNACTKSINSLYVEECVKNAVSALLSQFAPSVPSLPDSTEAVKDRLYILQRQLTQTQAQKSRLYDLLERGIYDEREFLERSSTVAKRIDCIRADIEKKRRWLEGFRYECESTEPMNQCFLRLYGSLTAAEKNTLYKCLIKRIVYSRGTNQKKNEFNLDIEWKEGI
ncbi:MAG: recombinase family protein [Clostridiales bacterium]|nr:recombinase family protein [Clostridiales bacterium]